MVKSLFDLKEDQFAIIADGTQCYCQKRSLKKPLVKPFVITSSNGRIINVYSDNAATDNDAFIMEKVLQNDKDLKNLLKRGDLAIFDRGFKECIARLKAAYGFNIPNITKYLHFLKIDKND
ncbi:transposable element tcb1 transposase [Brachionus plicatilis]|uniref:Transposable element tcb1 transposase n=1 Tax=Brachionus plicatilis TaxID=10195 RepID=A0A3M7SYE6_BRAPC|nr:transposable element tcb1 transposase [Brachionus plicatilis]